MTIFGRRFSPASRAVHARLAWLVCAAFVFLAAARATESDDGPPNQRSAEPARVKIRPESLDFGTQPVDTVSAPQTATLANTGPSVLTITDIIPSGIDFKQTNTCGQNLPAGASCTIQVTFKPAITGPRMATLLILDSDPASPQSIGLNGIGQ